MQTVADLIEYLQNLNQEAILIMSKDAEGNNYSPWCGQHSEGKYVPYTTWSGSFQTYENIDEGPEDDYSEFLEDIAVEAVVLWPIN